MFRVYKPKNFVKVRALQVTAENVNDVAALLLGRVGEWPDENYAGELPPTGIAPNIRGVEVATFDGVKRFEIGSWVIRAEDNSLSRMSPEEFDKTYEVARNMSGNGNN